MKKTLVFALLLTSLAACHSDDETSKNIVSVSALDDIQVAAGTEFATIEFPTSVSVTYSDNTSEEIGVTFSEGTYNNAEPGTYALVGTLSPSNGTTNTSALNASINVVVMAPKLKSVAQDGVVTYQYFYDDLGRLDYFTINTYEYHYSYSANNQVTQRLRKASGNDYPEKYFYHPDGTLDRIEFYLPDNTTISQTWTYTVVDGKITRYDNSDQSINTLKYRTFEYDANNNITKVAFDSGNPWNYTYFTDKKVAAPLVLDLANPQNQTLHPVESFTFVEVSSYTSQYTYNAFGYPTEEVRTYPGDGNSQSTFTYTYE
jgi:hypothetical protein